MTIILHGTWIPSKSYIKGRNKGEGFFFIWGERSFKSSATKRRRRASSEVQRAKAHPFNALTEEIITYLSPTLIEDKFETKITFLLPSLNGSVMPSSSLLIQEDIANEEPSTSDELNGQDDEFLLLPWRVNGLGLKSKEAARLLLHLDDSEHSSVLLGEDIKFWMTTTKFSLELLAKEEIIPTIWSKHPKESKDFRAAWRLHPEGARISARLKSLSEAMPDISRAFLPSKVKDEGSSDSVIHPSAQDLMEDYLNVIIDETVRGWLSKSHLLSTSRKKAKRSPLTRKGQPVDPDVIEEWLEHLMMEDPSIDLLWSKLKTLYSGVQAWIAQLRAADIRAAFRTCFLLEEPKPSLETEVIKKVKKEPTEEGIWTLRYLLQATDDPSLLIPADKIWEESGAVLQFLNRRFENPQERLLADLGKATRIFSPIEESLKTARPTNCTLPIDKAYEFLKEAAPVLEESGYGILTPQWWKMDQKSRGLGLRLQVKRKKESRVTDESLFSFDSLVSYDWRLSLGDETLSKEEFMRLASLKIPLVRIRGQWVELKPEQMAAAAAFLKRKGSSGETSLVNAVRIGLGLQNTLGVSEELPVVGLEAEGEVKDLMEKFWDAEKIEMLPQPKGFRGKLRPYQIRGYSWLVFMCRRAIGPCLADDMGLGKTIQLISLLLSEREKGLASNPTLLICPTSVVGNWHREVEKFGPSLKVMVHHGTERLFKTDFLKAVPDYDLVISTYSLVHRDIEDLKKVNWTGIVLDEAQNIKNPHAKQSIATRQLPGGYKVALTGTPIENRLSELWSIMEFLNPGYLGSLEGFRKKFAIPIERYQDKKATKTLARLISPFILRRLKTDPKVIDDLPEKQEIKVYCDLTKEQATLYQAVVDDMIATIDDSEGIERRGLILSALTKLKEICNHPAQFLKDGSALPGRSGKLQRLSEMLEETLAVNDRVLIFTQFAQMGQLLRYYLQEKFGTEVLFLHGGVRRKIREHMVTRFQNEPDGPRIFILSLKAGGTGLNLTRANHVFHFDRWWNPAVEDQATDRAFRIGQKRNVQVHKFICSGTLEERIDDLIEAKKSLSKEVIGAGEGWLTELSTNELKELFALRSQVVE